MGKLKFKTLLLINILFLGMIQRTDQKAVDAEEWMKEEYRRFLQQRESEQKKDTSGTINDKQISERKLSPIDAKDMKEMSSLVNDVLSSFDYNKPGNDVLKKDIAQIKKIAEKMGINTNEKKKDTSTEKTILSDSGKVGERTQPETFNPKSDSKPVKGEEALIEATASKKDSKVAVKDDVVEADSKEAKVDEKEVKDEAKDVKKDNVEKVQQDEKTSPTKDKKDANKPLSYEEFARAFRSVATEVKGEATKRGEEAITKQQEANRKPVDEDTRIRKLPLDELYAVLKRETQALKDNARAFPRGGRDNAQHPEEIDRDLEQLMPTQKKKDGPRRDEMRSDMESAKEQMEALLRTLKKMDSKRQVSKFRKVVYFGDETNDKRQQRYQKLSPYGYGDASTVSEKSTTNDDVVDKFIDDFETALRQSDGVQDNKRELVLKFFRDFTAGTGGNKRQFNPRNFALSSIQNSSNMRGDYSKIGDVRKRQMNSMMRGDVNQRQQNSRLMRGDAKDRTDSSQGVTKREVELARRVINGLMDQREPR